MPGQFQHSLSSICQRCARNILHLHSLAWLVWKAQWVLYSPFSKVDAGFWLITSFGLLFKTSTMHSFSSGWYRGHGANSCFVENWSDELVGKEPSSFQHNHMGGMGWGLKPSTSWFKFQVSTRNSTAGLFYLLPVLFLPLLPSSVDCTVNRASSVVTQRQWIPFPSFHNCSVTTTNLLLEQS